MIAGMSKQDAPIFVDAGAWTGPPSVGPRPVHLPADPERRQDRLIALLLCALFILLWVSWWLLLSLYSPDVPSPQTGQTVALRLRQFGPAIHVRPIEALISAILAVSAFLGPAAYLLVAAIRRRARR
jgi:hypothetical protein